MNGRVFEEGIFEAGVFVEESDVALTAGQPASKAETEGRLASLEAMVTGAFRSGSGDPDPAMGVDGQHYLDLDNGRLFKKAAGAWVFQGEVWLDKDGVAP